MLLYVKNFTAFLLPEVIQPIAAYHYLYVLSVPDTGYKRKDIRIILIVCPCIFILFNYFSRFNTYPAGRYDSTSNTAAYSHLQKSLFFNFRKFYKPLRKWRRHPVTFSSLTIPSCTKKQSAQQILTVIFFSCFSPFRILSSIIPPPPLSKVKRKIQNFYKLQELKNI